MPAQTQVAEDRFDMTEIEPARDIADFHLRWREFRPLALEIVQVRTLNRPQAETLAWMIDLIDRIGAGDIDGN